MVWGRLGLKQAAAMTGIALAVFLGQSLAFAAPSERSHMALASSPAGLVPSLVVQAYQESVGWRAAVSDGSSCGGDGSGLALQGLRVSVGGSARDLAGNVAFELLNAQGSWSVVAGGSKEPWAAGTQSAAGFKGWLTGDMAAQFDLCYQVSVAQVGWLEWVKNGEETGVRDVALPLDGLRLKLVPKGDRLPEGGGINQTWVRPAELAYWVYESGVGQVGPARSGARLGEPGKALHDIKVQLEGADRLPGGLAYRVNTGNWRPWVEEGSACPVEPNAPVYALQISLSGVAQQVYDLWYRTFIDGVGWLDFAKGGEVAGSFIPGRPVDQVEIYLLPKGSAAPGATARPTVSSDTMGLCLASINGASWGLTSLGGYDVSSAAGERLRATTMALTSRGAALSYVMVDIYTGRGVAYNADEAIYVASSIKGPYVAAVNKFNPAAVSGGVRETMRQTIQYSSNEGYVSLWNRFGSWPLAQLQGFVGGCSFSPSVRYTNLSAKDLAKLWVGVYDYFFVHQNQNSSWCQSLYTNPYLSFIHQALGGRATTYTKPGWIGSGPGLTARNDAGIVMAANGPYVVAILSTAYGHDALLGNLAQALDGVHSDLGRWN